ncbi:MAG: ARMT1-like domain-containing protein [Candidatus Heimdallarchaeum endolithica]|uniref:ARMT1-like domain-containing protein n=1 Tax=Candidatus Heimdallarchaeum endolithica TaxID=2876572 RepID=A0A9Y1BTS3_9ARCH|nr:MAG: ARMT1-like domain-containing protein [Candidatus Heimdallarchaeum endolithica]
MVTDQVCLECIKRTAERAINKLKINEPQKKNIVKNINLLLEKIDKTYSPIEINFEVFSKISSLSGIYDPLKELKEQSNLNAYQLLPYVKEEKRKSKDVLFSLIKAAVAGNIIDFSIDKEVNLQKTLKEVLKSNFAINDYKLFLEKLKDAKKVQLLTDNAGEIIFDLELLAFLQKRLNKKVIIITKRYPFSNDITLKEVKTLTKKIKLKGKIISINNKNYQNYKNEIKKKLDNKAVVISKGQGNYELLSDEKLNIFFLLMMKCPIIAKEIGCNVGDVVFFQK